MDVQEISTNLLRVALPVCDARCTSYSCASRPPWLPLATVFRDFLGKYSAGHYPLF
jgi:hypothetical protein